MSLEKTPIGDALVRMERPAIRVPSELTTQRATEIMRNRIDRDGGIESTGAARLLRGMRDKLIDMNIPVLTLDTAGSSVTPTRDSSQESGVLKAAHVTRGLLVPRLSVSEGRRSLRGSYMWDAFVCSLRVDSGHSIPSVEDEGFDQSVEAAVENGALYGQWHTIPTFHIDRVRTDEIHGSPMRRKVFHMLTHTKSSDLSSYIDELGEESEERGYIDEMSARFSTLVQPVTDKPPVTRSVRKGHINAKRLYSPADFSGLFVHKDLARFVQAGDRHAVQI